LSNNSPHRRHCTGSVSGLVVASLALASLLAGSIASGAQLADATQPISLDAASSDFDYRNNLLTFRKVRIAQGNMSVEADEATATGLDFENSEWKFTGSVRIRMQNGRLDSDAATIRFRNNQIGHARIEGMPATFEQQGDEQQVARGRAGTIEYDVTRGTIELKDKAWLSDGKNEITGQTLVYDMLKERVLANPGEQDPGGVSIIINPRNITPPKAPAPGPGS
jgi:lipopolysaccharide transport protein LptA